MLSPSSPAYGSLATGGLTAEAVVIDIQDPSAALGGVRSLLEHRNRYVTAQIWVRVHSVRSSESESELRLLQGLVDGFVIPDVQCVQDLEWVAGHSPGTPLIPVLECSQALPRVLSIARHSSVRRLGFSSLSTSCDLSDGMLSLENAVSWAHRMIVGASASAKLPGPVGGLHPALQDDAQLLQDATLAVRTGFTGYCSTSISQLAYVEMLLAEGVATGRGRPRAARSV
ncbi:aldolase/citrate lyase family protein [Streptomyces sp. NPDC000410]|uniref:aldolase/citrate lyase family protein n=1 Tax=Streptomyces sp. NPDC000410 TaxID=3154254 RepID=UPI0033198EE1